MQNNFIHTAVPLRLMMSPCHPCRAVSVCFTQPSVSSVGKRIIIIFLSVTIKTCCETICDSAGEQGHIFSFSMSRNIICVHLNLVAQSVHL